MPVKKNYNEKLKKTGIFFHKKRRHRPLRVPQALETMRIRTSNPTFAGGDCAADSSALPPIRRSIRRRAVPTSIFSAEASNSRNPFNDVDAGKMESGASTAAPASWWQQLASTFTRQRRAPQKQQNYDQPMQQHEPHDPHNQHQRRRQRSKGLGRLRVLIDKLSPQQLDSSRSSRSEWTAPALTPASTVANAEFDGEFGCPNVLQQHERVKKQVALYESLTRTRTNSNVKTEDFAPASGSSHENQPSAPSSFDWLSRSWMLRRGWRVRPLRNQKSYEY